MKVSNQKPVELEAIYNEPSKGTFDPVGRIKTTITEPLFTPLSQNSPVVMTDNGNDVTEDDITQLVINCCGDTVNVAAEDKLKKTLAQTLVYFKKNTTLSIQELFVIQAAVKENLPEPNPKVIYAPATDVIPVSKEFLGGKCTYEKFFASLALYARPSTLGFYFASENDFEDFKTWLDGIVTALAPTLTPEVVQLFQQARNLKLDGLTESLILRNNEADNNEDLSFARILIDCLMTYTAQISPAQFGILPFSLNELHCPKTLVFVNVSTHARATAKQVSDEWLIINKSLQTKVKVMSNKKISKLTTVARQLQKAHSSGAAAGRQSDLVQAARAKFRKTAPSGIDIAKILAKVSKKMANVKKSSNPFKSRKNTFAKANRRDPDDFNKQGVMTSVKYKPDIHIYLDTSGSISENNYQSTIKACIAMARKMNVDLYFNSFSHKMSQCTKLKTRDKSSVEIYKAFQRVPKVGGGTDYEQIWNYINKSNKRDAELSIIITDFEYTAPNRFVKHPKNLYYIPCANMNWTTMVKEAAHFCDSMKHNDPDCRSKLLM